MPRVAALFDATPDEEALLREAAGAAGLRVAPRPTPRDLAGVEVAVVFSFSDLPEDALGPAVRWIVSLPAGADHVPYARLPPGARVVSLHGPNALAIAEHALALLLAAAKGIVRDTIDLRAGRFTQQSRPASRRIAGARLVVVGAGALGGEILRLGQALGMRTTCVRASGAPHAHADEVARPDALRDALARADYAALAVPLTRDTRGMIGEAELAAMKEDAVLVNVARGKLVDRDALAAHLDARPAFTYATDVWWRYPRDEDEEAWDEPLARRVVGTPHAAALVPGWRVRMVEAAARVVADVLAGRPPDGAAGRIEDPARYAR